jgi:hypothetical protein
MGFCFGKRNKLESESVPEMKKFVELEIVELRNQYENIKINGKLLFIQSVIQQMKLGFHTIYYLLLNSS